MLNDLTYTGMNFVTSSTLVYLFQIKTSRIQNQTVSKINSYDQRRKKLPVPDQTDPGSNSRTLSRTKGMRDESENSSYK
jgi:hypothetical protein